MFTSYDAAADTGPIPMPNHHPLYIGLLYPVPDRAAIADKTRWSVALNHTNIFMMYKSEKWSASIDKEITEADLSARAPLIENRLEAGVKAPFYRSSEGFMDNLVRWYHKRIGAPSYYGQEESPDFRYLDTVTHNGELVRKGRRGDTTPGDVEFWLKALVWKGKGAAVSVQALAQAPTGDADAGTGSGDWEYGLRLLAGAEHGPMAYHAGAGVTSPGSLKLSKEDIKLDTMFMGFLGVEYEYSSSFSFLSQSMYNTSPFPSADIIAFSRQWWEVTFGFKWRLREGKTMTFGLSENLNQIGPDFTIHVSFEN